MLHGKNHIGYTLSSGHAKQFQVWSPQKQEFLPEWFDEVTPQDCEIAVKKAAEAFESYARISAADRARFLDAIARQLEDHRAVLEKRFVLESALPESRAKVELNRTIFQLHEFASLLRGGMNAYHQDRPADPTRVSGAAPSLHKRFFPLGPVVVFGASNFPFAYSTIGGDSASALAAGCPVIVKAHPMHAGTGELVTQLVIEAAQQCGMPDGVFSNLNSSGYQAGIALVQHPLVKAVGFTGSYEGGMALYRLAQQRQEPIPFFAEMGSINPVVCLPEKLNQDAEKMAQMLAASISLHAGQFCTNPGLIIGLSGQAWDQFKNKLKAQLAGENEQYMLHPNILQRYEQMAQSVLDAGAKPLLDEQKTASAGCIYPRLREIEAALFLKDQRLSSEVFGIHTLLVNCADTTELNQVIRHLHGQLTATLFASEKELNNNSELIFLLATKAGRVILNGVPTGVEVDQAMQHGGPFPATTDPRFTAVGREAIFRFLRPVCFQNFQEHFPGELTT